MSQLDADEIMDEADDQADLVAFFVCGCGRRQGIEYTPPESSWGLDSLICACGARFKFTEDDE
jgi:hypothetical protein